MINSRKIEDLTPEVQILCKKFIDSCAATGIDILITSTYRDKESQAALYAQGRTTPGKVVTNAKAGYSYHNYHVAFDFVPIENGKAMWNSLDVFRRCGKIAEELGLEWAGNWPGKFKEMAHCQLTGDKTIQDYLKEA
jgi:peptidoglycan L-alanyl-D-glutamate endopeptidase CwlK